MPAAGGHSLYNPSPSWKMMTKSV